MCNSSSTSLITTNRMVAPDATSTRSASVCTSPSTIWISITGIDGLADAVGNDSGSVLRLAVVDAGAGSAASPKSPPQPARP
jgi:hypothetical protein